MGRFIDSGNLELPESIFFYDEKRAKPHLLNGTEAKGEKAASRGSREVNTLGAYTIPKEND